MRFGGHETFPVREGWLHKGLTLVEENPDAFSQPDVADTLGVGRNMAKAVRHWLIATALAGVQPAKKGSKTKILKPTSLGALVLRHDKYFLRLGTWLALHINLVNNPNHARTWQWFFSRFGEQRFDRIACSEALKRHLNASGQRPPALRTLQRDVACLLSSYATPIPTEAADPEDASDSPFRRLGLLTYFRDSHIYRRNEVDVESIPSELLGFALTASGSLQAGDLPLREACFVDGGLGRCLHLSLDSFIDVVEKAEAELPEGVVRVIGSAGERKLKVAERSPNDWLESYYLRLKDQAVAA